jgi:hypothetical protein
MTPRARDRRSLAGVVLLAVVAAAAMASPQAGCAARKPSKLAGPPPEYEPPEAPDAWLPLRRTPDLDAASP